MIEARDSFIFERSKDIMSAYQALRYRKRHIETLEHRNIETLEHRNIPLIRLHPVDLVRRPTFRPPHGFHGLSKPPAKI